MRKIFLLPILFSSIPLLGQNHVLGLKSGINLTNVHSDIFGNNNNNRTGLHFGLTYEYRLNNYFNTGAELIYLQKGFRSDIIFTNEVGIPTGEKAILIFNYDYLSIPIKCGFSIGDKISGFVSPGLVPSILVDAKMVEPALEGYSNEKTIDITHRVTKFDLGGLIEIGGNYKLTESFTVFSSLVYIQSFTTITNSHYYSGYKTKHYGMTMSFGLKYILNNSNE